MRYVRATQLSLAPVKSVIAPTAATLVHCILVINR